MKILSVGMCRRTVWYPGATVSARHFALAFRAEVLCGFELVSAMSIDSTVYQVVTLFNLKETTTFRGKLLLPSSGSTKYMGLSCLSKKCSPHHPAPKQSQTRVIMSKNFLHLQCLLITSLMLYAFHEDILV